MLIKFGLTNSPMLIIATFRRFCHDKSVADWECFLKFVGLDETADFAI